MKIPKVIYLQIRDEDGKLLDSRIDEAVTWCTEQINDNDEAYVRLSRLRAAIEEITAKKTEHYGGNVGWAYYDGMGQAQDIIKKHFPEIGRASCRERV